MTDIESIIRTVIREELRPIVAALDEMVNNLRLKPAVESSSTAGTRHAMQGPSGPRAEPDMIEADQFGPGLPPQRMTRAEFVASLPPIEPDRWISTAQAAEILGVRPRTMEHWRRQGKGPQFRRIGRLVKYDAREIHRMT